MKRKVSCGMMLGLCVMLAVGCVRPLAKDITALAPTGPGPAPNRVVEMELQTRVPSLPPAGRELRLWVPMPTDDKHQTVKGAQVITSLRPLMQYDTVHGDGMLFFSGDEPLPDSLLVTVKGKVELHRCDRPAPTPEFPTEPTGPSMQPYLEIPDREQELSDQLRALETRTPTTEQNLEQQAQQKAQMTEELARARQEKERLKEIVSQFDKAELKPLERAREVYDHLLVKLSLATEPAPPRSLVQAYDSGSVSELEFARITALLLRTLGIPARVEYGLVLPEEPTADPIEIRQPHVWAGLYLGAAGWMPVDPVAAKQTPGLEEYYFGTDCARRIRFGVGSDITLSPPQLGGPLPIFFTPVVEVDKETLQPEFKVIVRDLAGATSPPKTTEKTP